MVCPCKKRRQKLNSIQETDNVSLKNKESADVNNRQIKHLVNLSSLLTLLSRYVINYVKDPFCASRLICWLNISCFIGMLVILYLHSHVQEWS